MLEYFCRSVPLGALLTYMYHSIFVRLQNNSMKPPAQQRFERLFYYPVTPLQILQNERNNTSEGAIKCAS